MSRYLGEVTDHGPACGHPTRYRTMGGRIQCETCARLHSGWGICAECGDFEKLHVFEDPEFGPVDEQWRVCRDCQRYADAGGDFNEIEIAI